MKIARIIKEMKFLLQNTPSYNGKLGERNFGDYIPSKRQCVSNKPPFGRTRTYDVDVSVSKWGLMPLLVNTGSGKSTMIQHLKWFIAADKHGTVQIGEHLISAGKKEKKLTATKKKKYVKSRGCLSNSQNISLFEETVEKDICFRPTKFEYL